MTRPNTDRKVAENRKAFYDYEILESYEAGIALKGTEVKSVRKGSINLKDGFARIFKGELFLFNVHISPYEQGNVHNQNPLRERKLLMHKDQIESLAGRMSRGGLALVPISAYFKRGRLKIQLGLGKGKKHFDKRETIKKRDIEKEERRYRINL